MQDTQKKRPRAEILCIGKAGQSFARQVESNPNLCKSCNLLILDDLELSPSSRAIYEGLVGASTFCVFGAASSKSILKVMSLLNSFPSLWQSMHFVLVHPFNFEGHDKAKKAKENSDFLVRQGAKVTDLYNQDLFNYADKNAKFDDGFAIMNGWIAKVINEHGEMPL